MPANKEHPLFKVRFTFTQGTYDRPTNNRHVYRMLHAKDFLTAMRTAMKVIPAAKAFERLSKVSVQQLTPDEE